MDFPLERQNDADQIRRTRKLLMDTYRDEQEREVKRKVWNRTARRMVLFVCAWFLAMLILSLLMPKKAHAEILESKAIACILGEARGEGFASMLAHAEAIRARGTLKGVYGCRADLTKEMSYLNKRGITYKATRAWRMSETSSTINGAQFWASTIVDQKWIAKMERAGFVRTAKIKNTVFYKEIKNHDRSR